MLGLCNCSIETIGFFSITISLFSSISRICCRAPHRYGSLTSGHLVELFWRAIQKCYNLGSGVLHVVLLAWYGAGCLAVSIIPSTPPIRFHVCFHLTDFACYVKFCHQNSIGSIFHKHPSEINEHSYFHK